MSESQFQEIELEDHEVTPLQFLQIGVARRDDGQSAGYEVTLLTDLETRPDLVGLIEAHRASEGHCSTVWTCDPEKPASFTLLLTFKVPVAAKALVAFDLLRNGPIVDCLVEGQSRLRIVPGKVGENLRDVIEENRPHLAVEVVASLPRERWEKHWSSVVADELGISKEEGLARVRFAQQDMQLRIVAPDLPPLDQLAGMFVDDEGKLIVTTKELLTNRLKRDSSNVTESFDRFFWPEVEELSDEYSRLSAAVVPALIRAGKSGDELTWTLGQLIGNALGSIVAALELVRLGHRLQPGILLRTAIETVCIAASLFHKPQDFGRFMAGRMDSGNAVSEAKKVLPFIGKLYGFLSKEFTHIGSLHRRLQVSDEYESADDDAAKTNLMGIHLALENIWMIADLVFYESIATHRYWRKTEPGKFEFDIPDAIRQRMGEIASRLSTGDAAMGDLLSDDPTP